ncbi:hypothetical protein J5I95_18500, partial [Candidatus Poribacteria bacterium]|nr:hypothetical protein [Candidatus Poribacteria bacterium]
STLDDLAIFHVVVKHWEAYGSRIDMKFTTYQGADWEDREGDLTKAKFFRSGDKITMNIRFSTDITLLQRDFS